VRLHSNNIYIYCVCASTCSTRPDINRIQRIVVNRYDPNNSDVYLKRSVIQALPHDSICFVRCMDCNKYCILFPEGKMDCASNSIRKFISSVCTSNSVALKQRNGKATFV
jgi:hypothetical protein